MISDAGPTEVSDSAGQPMIITGGTRIGRFHLDDLIVRDIGGSVWRATDERLGRRVLVRVVLTSDPRIDEIRTAACAASRVSHRNVAQVLDVLVTPDALVIVAEWVEGIPLGELLSAPLATAAAVRLTMTVATAVSAIHAAGTSHGRITPNCVLIGPRGEVKVRGHVVDAALWGTELGLDPVSSDLVSLGSILLACLTTKWPLAARDGLRPAPMIGGVAAVPSQLVADVPAALDRAFSKAMANVPSPRVSHSVSPYADIGSLVDGLVLAHHELTQAVQTTSRPRRSHLRRVLAVVAGVAVAGALAAGGIGLIVATVPNAPRATPQTSPSDWHAPPTPSAAPPQVRTLAPEQTLPIVAIWELGATEHSDSLGQPQGAASPGAATVPTGPGAAVDTSMSSAWRTPRYRKAANVSSKPVGLVVDLGVVSTVQAFDIGLLGDGADIAVAATSTRPTARVDKNILASITGAAPLTTLRIPRPVTARYVAIWFLRVPAALGGYQGGITNISVTGSPVASLEP